MTGTRTVVGLSPSWWGAGVLVVAGWLAGFFLWQMPDSPESYGMYFDIGIPAVMLVVGAPAAGIAAALRSSGGARSIAGSVLMLLAALGLAYLASFAFFGGFCLDPNDVCITTWPSRVAALATAIAILAAAGSLERFCHHVLWRKSREE